MQKSATTKKQEGYKPANKPRQPKKQTAEMKLNEEMVMIISIKFINSCIFLGKRNKGGV